MTEKSPGGSRIIYVLIGAVVGALAWWGLHWLLDHAGDLDEKPLPNGVREELNQRKAEAMHDLLDAMVKGELDEVEAAAKRMEKSKKAVASFLDTDEYEQERAIFFKAIDDVREAAGDNDLEATEEAALALERSCFHCHNTQLNK